MLSSDMNLFIEGYKRTHIVTFILTASLPLEFGIGTNVLQ